MQQFMIRYQTKPGQAALNEELVRAVFAELDGSRPAGLSYATFKLADQVTFVHLVQASARPTPLVEVKAFAEFQKDTGSRFQQPPVTEDLTLIGSYRMFHNDGDATPR